MFSIPVKPANTSVPQVLLNIMQQLTIVFTVNESLFEAIPVGVMFSSNCTINLTVAYINPVYITVNDTGLKVAVDQCQYSIQLVDGNLQQIGFPITGYFGFQGAQFLQ